jgi:hypothetical protein
MLMPKWMNSKIRAAMIFDWLEQQQLPLGGLHAVEGWKLCANRREKKITAHIKLGWS